MPAQHAAFLRALSLLSLASGLFALSRGHAALAPVPLAVCATSLLYWREPLAASWTRALDVGVVQAGLFLQSLAALRGAERRAEYFALLSVGLAAFPLAVLLDRRAKARGESSAAATLLHGAGHVFGNAANCALYSGAVRPLFDSEPLAA